jgi:hypothetical protein
MREDNDSLFNRSDWDGLGTPAETDWIDKIRRRAEDPCTS